VEPVFDGRITGAAGADAEDGVTKRERGRPERRIWAADVRQDVDDELSFHLEMRQRDLMEQGLADATARDAALRRFGNRERIAAECQHVDEAWLRDQRHANMWTDIRQDFSYAVRSLVKSPGFTVAALVTLALGIGANTAIFSIIDGVLLRPLPYHDPGQLAFLWSTSESRPRMPLTPGRLVDFRERLTSATGVAGISHLFVNLTGGGDPERIAASSVSSNFFDVLGAPPLLGDPFHAGNADDRAVVLSHRLWARRFGADRSLVGREIVLNGTARRVVAVMPPEFAWPAITPNPSGFEGPQLWVPAARREIPRTPSDNPDADISANRGSGYLRAVVRVKTGVSVDQARSEARRIADALAREHPQTDTGRGADIVPMHAQFFGAVQTPLLILLGAVAFILAIACANVAALLLGRGTARRREIAVRLALGATRGRVIRQLLVESVALATSGAALGVLVGWWAQSAFVALEPVGFPRLDAVGLNPTVLSFTLAIGFGAGVLFGIVPAWQISGAAMNEALTEGSRGSTGPRAGRTRDMLVAAQVSIALVLLVGAVLLLRSFVALSKVDTGIDTRNLLTFDMFLSGPRAEYQSRQIAFYSDVLRDLRALPGVTHAAAAVTLPIGGDDFAAPVAIEGQPPPPLGKEPTAGYQVVTPRFFETMGIPLLAGRDFRDADTRDAPRVALVNRSFARHHWPEGDPIGRRLRITGADNPWLTVVGVVDDIRHRGPATPPRPEFYEAHLQRSFPFMAFVVRTSGDPGSVVPAIRAAVARLDPAQPISGVATMDAHIERALSHPRFISLLVGGFGLLALALASVGIYGVMAYAVAQRSREIAIRMALGARRGDVVAMVLSKAARLAGYGIATGILAAWLLSGALGGMLFGVSQTDLVTFIAVPVLLITVALAAGMIPALRASRIDSSVLRF
jgi:predicted permease